MNNRFDDFRVVRLWRGMNRLSQLALAICLVCGVLYLASQPNFYFRRDISATRAHSLSPETLAQLRSVAERDTASKESRPPVEIFLTLPKTVKGEGENADKMRAVLDTLNPRVESLLDTFSYELRRDGRLRVSVRRIDQTVQARTYRELSDALLAQGGRMNPFTALVVRCGDRVRALDANALFGMSKAGLGDYDRFRGESALLSAFLDVTDFRRTIIYYTVNHGELAPNGLSPARADSQFFADLAARRCEMRPLDLANVQDIPEDADMVLVAGPRIAFRPIEAELLRRYAKSARNGRVMVLLEPLARTGLEELFRDWGVRAPGALVIEQDKNSRTAEGDISVMGHYEALSGHPAVRSFFELGAPLVSGALAPLQADNDGAKDDDTLDVKQLLFTSQNSSWGEWDVGVAPHYDEKAGDIPPPVCVLMTAERSVRVNGQSRIPGGRLFVLGSTDVASDMRFTFNGNRQMLIGATNWLTGREYLVNVPARPLSVYRVNATFDDLADLGKRYAILPLFVALAGFFVGWWRRRA